MSSSSRRVYTEKNAVCILAKRPRYFFGVIHRVARQRAAQCEAVRFYEFRRPHIGILAPARSTVSRLRIENVSNYCRPSNISEELALSAGMKRSRCGRVALSSRPSFPLFSGKSHGFRSCPAAAGLQSRIIRSPCSLHRDLCPRMSSRVVSITPASPWIGSSMMPLYRHVSIARPNRGR